MNANKNQLIISQLTEITVAKMNSSSIIVSEAGGKAVADFMQGIYDKLVELYEVTDNDSKA